MVVYWYVKLTCDQCDKGMQRKLVAGKTLTSDELEDLQERYNNHCQWRTTCRTALYETYKQEDTADYAEPPSILQPLQQQQPQQQQQQQQQQQCQMQQPPPSPPPGEFKLQLHYVPPGSPAAVNRLQLQQQQPQQQQQTEETASLQQELLRQMVALQQQMRSLQQQVEALNNKLSGRGAAGEAGAAQSTASGAWGGGSWAHSSNEWWSPP